MFRSENLGQVHKTIDSYRCKVISSLSKSTNVRNSNTGAARKENPTMQPIPTSANNPVTPCNGPGPWRPRHRRDLEYQSKWIDKTDNSYTADNGSRNRDHSSSSSSYSTDGWEQQGRQRRGGQAYRRNDDYGHDYNRQRYNEKR